MHMEPLYPDSEQQQLLMSSARRERVKYLVGGMWNAFGAARAGCLSCLQSMGRSTRQWRGARNLTTS